MNAMACRDADLSGPDCHVGKTHTPPVNTRQDGSSRCDISDVRLRALGSTFVIVLAVVVLRAFNVLAFQPVAVVLRACSAIGFHAPHVSPCYILEKAQ
ncbi:hypothetical protein C1J03_08575 [Sulfitobacter sp. SK012]|nr:hypothetical protein C1J03_08575 [Sulfitobacter sp. SK012]